MRKSAHAACVMRDRPSGSGCRSNPPVTSAKPVRFRESPKVPWTLARGPCPTRGEEPIGDAPCERAPERWQWRRPRAPGSATLPTHRTDLADRRRDNRRLTAVPQSRGCPRELRRFGRLSADASRTGAGLGRWATYCRRAMRTSHSSSMTTPSLEPEHPGGNETVGLLDLNGHVAAVVE